MEAYLFIITASILFSIQFAFTKKYQTSAGTGMKSSFLYNALSPVAFFLIMFFIDGCKLQFTTFSIVMSLLWAIVCNVITFYSIQALALGSVSNYSLFLLGGGMILPAIYGAIWGGDTFGIFKIIGILLVLAAVCIKIDFKEKADKRATFAFIMLFLLNGLVGILASIYQSDLLPFARPSATQYSIQRALATILVGALLFGGCVLFGKNETQEQTLSDHLKASPWAAISGLINGVANLLLLFSLVTIEPSLQYPIITGGSIFLSALVGLIFKEKPDKRTWIAVALAVAGTIVMVF